MLQSRPTQSAQTAMPSRRHIFAAALVIAALKTTGCGGARQGNLGGEVFIVTEGAANVKLGLVEVRVLPLQETQNSIAQAKQQAEREKTKLQIELDAARGAYLSAQVRLRAAADSIPTNEETKDDTPAWDRWRAANSARRAAKARVAEIQEQIRTWDSGAPYFANLPAAVASEKTDADGKFSLTIDRSKTVVLAAQATRRIMDKAENYYWLITVSLDGQPTKRIFLSNDNLATADSKDSLIHVVE